MSSDNTSPGAPVRYPNGVTNVDADAIFSELKNLDPTQFHTFFRDFDVFANWTTTTVGAGSAALADEDGGAVLLTNAAADDDSTAIQHDTESFLFETGKKLYFKARLKVSDATQSDLVVGIQITDTTPFDVTDGVFFKKDDGDTNLDFVVEKNNTNTESTAITTISDDTYFVVSFYYDGVDKILFDVDGTVLGSSVTTNLPDDEELTVSIAVQNGEAVAKTMSIDYAFVAKER